MSASRTVADAATARPIPGAAATAFLGRDPVGNSELLAAIRNDGDVRCLGAARGGALAGVAVIGQEDGGALAARFEAADAGALAALIAACPPAVERIAVHRAWMLPALVAAFTLMPYGTPETVYALAGPPAQPPGEARPLTARDVPLMAASATLWGVMGLPDALRAGLRPFGIVRGARVLACALAASGTEWTEEVMSVWTAPRHRGRGLATAVVAATAADIIGRGKTALYVAAVTNHASRRVAAKVGFQPRAAIAAYRVARR